MIETRPAPRAVGVTLPEVRLPGLPSLGVPGHVGVILGLSTGAYALSLALVSGLQASSEAAIAAQRAPALATIAAVDRSQTKLEGDLARAQTAYESAAAAYAATGTGFQAMESSLGDLAAAVAAVNGAAASMPATVKLPAVSRSVTNVAAPVVHATTAASGG